MAFKTKGADDRFPPVFDDLTDSRDTRRRCRDSGTVRGQISDLTSWQDEPALWERVIADLQARRAYRWDDPGYDRIEAVPQPSGVPTLVVPGEVLFRVPARADRRLARAYAVLKQEGFEPIALGCDALEGRLERWRLAEPDPSRHDRVTARLRYEGFPAALNYITPLQVVVKGLGGPEPTTIAPPVAAQAPTEGVARVAVIDTGINVEHRTDVWLEGLQRKDNRDPLDEYPEGGDKLLDYAAGHGTATAGIVRMVDREAVIDVRRAVDSDGIGSELRVACALVEAVRDGARIVNLSLGVRTVGDVPPVALDAALDAVAEIGLERGEEVLLVAAAGNFGDTRPVWPAAFPRVVAVGGLTPGGFPARWSSSGPWVDASAVAEGVVAPYVKGTESAEFDLKPDTYPDNAWAVFVGTSFAAPQVAGAVSRLAREQRLPPRLALHALLARGTTVPGWGRALRLLPGTP